MFRKLALVVALVMGATLISTPAHADPVKPRRGEGIYSMTARSCGSAASWRQQAAHNRITASSGYLVYYGRTYDIDCPGAVSRNARKPVAAKGWIHPLASGRRAGSCWHAPRDGGRRLHEGIDIGAPRGVPIRAVAAGRVVRAGWRGGYGYAVEVSHGNGITTLYAHASRIVVWGGSVRKGQTIARIGDTGNPKPGAYHLHFEVRRNGTAINPATFLRARGISVGC